jgi:hypothetical protein
VVGRGKQGIHDVMAGVAICRVGQSVGELVSRKKLIVLSSIVATVLAFAITIMAMKVFSLVGFDSMLIDYSIGGKQKIEADSSVKELDSVWPATPLKCRSYDLKYGISWWVDLTCDPKEQKRFVQEVGLQDWNSTDLLGYGISVKPLSLPIILINEERTENQVLPVNSEILTVHIFVDSGAFFFPEIMAIVDRYFSSRFNASSFRRRYPIFRVKVTHMVKVGFVEVGFFREMYFLTTGHWRNGAYSRWPRIVNFDSRFLGPNRPLVAADIE